MCITPTYGAHEIRADLLTVTGVACELPKLVSATGMGPLEENIDTEMFWSSWVIGAKGTGHGVSGA